MRESGSVKVLREKQRQKHHILLRALKKLSSTETHNLFTLWLEVYLKWMQLCRRGREQSSEGMLQFHFIIVLSCSNSSCSGFVFHFDNNVRKSLKIFCGFDNYLMTPVHVSNPQHNVQEIWRGRRGDAANGKKTSFNIMYGLWCAGTSLSLTSLPGKTAVCTRQVMHEDISQCVK